MQFLFRRQYFPREMRKGAFHQAEISENFGRKINKIERFGP